MVPLGLRLQRVLVVPVCSAKYSVAARLTALPRDWAKMRVRQGGAPTTFIASSSCDGIEENSSLAGLAAVAPKSLIIKG